MIYRFVSKYPVDFIYGTSWKLAKSIGSKLFLISFRNSTQLGEIYEEVKDNPDPSSQPHIVGKFLGKLCAKCTKV